MFTDSSVSEEYKASVELRDVTSTARLFNFRRPVYLTDDVWNDCVDVSTADGKACDELAVLQRLRHVLFMAATALHGRVDDLEHDFRVYRVASQSEQGLRQPLPVSLRLSAHKDEENRPVITISFPESRKLETRQAS